MSSYRTRFVAFVASSLVLVACGSTGDRAPLALPSDTTPPEGVVETIAPPLNDAEPLVSQGPLNADAIAGLLSAYLPHHILVPNFDGEVFCAYEIYGWEKTDSVATAWAWTLCEEYYLNAGELTSGSGISAPVSIQISGSAAGWSITDHILPEDGSLYAESVRSMFPVEHAERALAHESVAHLSQRAEHAARSRLAS